MAMENEAIRFSGAPGVATAMRVSDPPWASSAEYIGALPCLSTPFFQQILEKIFAAIVLVATAPVMLLVAVLIRLDSPGPALFRQQRVGRGGKCFRFIKFRTYFHDAKIRFPHLYDYRLTADRLENYYFKVPDDPRATRVGRWLRKSTIDELPNFWHVLTGDMALVGPRPELPDLLPYYSNAELAIFTVPPGVTGLAQISGRGWLSFHATIARNLEYLRTRSFLGDMRIVFATVVKVVLRQGAF